MSNEESERITTSQDVISHLHDKIDEQEARIAELEKENSYLNDACAELEALLEAIGAGGVEPLRKQAAQAVHQIAGPAAPVGKPIEDAIDALVMAAFTEGGCSEHRMTEARIQTELRKKELRTLLSTPQACCRSHPHEEMTPMCELRTEIARLTNALARAEALLAAAQQGVQADVPVGGQSRFKGEKDWQWCSPEHVAMVLATPSEWQGYEVRYLYAHPAEGVPAQNVQPFGWLITKSKLPGDVEFTQDPVRENLARSFGYQTQALYTHSTQQGMDAIAALQKVRDIAVSALLTGSLDRQDWIDDMDRIAAQAKQGGAA